MVSVGYVTYVTEEVGIGLKVGVSFRGLSKRDCVRALSSNVREAFHYSGNGNDSGSNIHRRHVHIVQSGHC